MKQGESMTEGTATQSAGNGNVILTAVGVVALVAGLAIGGLALAAVAGVWLGIWDFRVAFDLLFNYANRWGGIVAALCLIDAVTILAIARPVRATNGARMAGFAFIGAIVAFIGYYIPSTYRPPDDGSIPGIHDISTDTSDPPQFVDVLPLRANAANTAEYGRSEGMTPEELTRLSRQAYPDLVPVMLDVSPDEAYQRALAAVTMLGWDLVAEVPAEGRIEATDTTFWLRFKDDIVIRIRPAPGGGSIVDARSVSRVGRGDAGTNARRLRAFFAAL